MNEADQKKAEEIVASLRLAGQAPPAAEAEDSEADEDPPALVIESAESVTTFSGFDADESRQWFDEADAAISAAFPPPENGQPEEGTPKKAYRALRSRLPGN